MKHPLLPRNVTALAATTLAVIGLALSSGAALAQTTKTLKGDFHSTDGTNGTYIETVATNGDTKTVTVVYTRRSDKKTSTDISTTVSDVATKSRTVAYSHTDFGSTAEYTSNKTVDRVKGGFVGKGTYKTAEGVTGTLTTLESTAGNVNVISADYAPTSGAAGTKALRVEEDALGFIAVRSFTLDPDGKTTSTILTRYVTE